MESFDWLESYPHCVTICDRSGIIIAMNRASADNFKKYGGSKLIGSSLFDCHPESACTIIQDLLARQKGNSYIVEKKGRKRLISQEPWYRDGIFSGLVETILNMPQDILTKQR